MELLNFIKYVTTFMFLTISIIVGLITISEIIWYEFDNVPVKLYVNQKEVWHGRSACINLDTKGLLTTVTISDGSFCLVPSAYYVNSFENIKVEGKK